MVTDTRTCTRVYTYCKTNLFHFSHSVPLLHSLPHHSISPILSHTHTNNVHLQQQQQVNTTFSFGLPVGRNSQYRHLNATFGFGFLLRSVTINFHAHSATFKNDRAGEGYEILAFSYKANKNN